MDELMMWVFAGLIVLAMGGVAMLAAGHGEPMAPAYDDRPDAVLPARRPVVGNDLRTVRFSLALRGYRMAEVDALLARLAAQIDGVTSTPVEVGARTPLSATPRTGFDEPVTVVDVHQEAEPEAPPELPVVVPASTIAQELAVRWAADHPAGSDIMDFSVESIDQMESLLDQWSMRASKVPATENDEVLAAGAYVGEILIRALPGSSWVLHADHGTLPVVLLPSGGIENPIGTAIRRYEGDERDSIVAFLEDVLAREGAVAD